MSRGYISKGFLKLNTVKITVKNMLITIKKMFENDKRMKYSMQKKNRTFIHRPELSC